MECSNKSSKEIFKFKQFSVLQRNVAMRVNTDGVLLGAYVVKFLDTSVKKVLDIGTGTGVIALMLAQKLHALFKDFKIDAIDIEEECYHVASENFTASPWSVHLNTFHTSLQEFSAQKLSSSSAADLEKYDLIVSNPPYFNNSLKNPSKEKSTARHTTKLSYKDLITSVVQLLKDNGTFAVIIPSSEKQKFLELAHLNFLYEKREVEVYSKSSDLEKDRESKRTILFLSKGIQTERIAQGIYLEEKNGERSAAYKNLTQDYYL